VIKIFECIVTFVVVVVMVFNHLDFSACGLTEYEDGGKFSAKKEKNNAENFVGNWYQSFPKKLYL
jgi:hypothetical protein